jgi:trimeric autotransporter adhesin
MIKKSPKSNALIFAPFKLWTVFLMMCLFSTNLMGQEPQLLKDWWTVNGIVHDVDYDPHNNHYYLAGSFTFIGPAQPFGACIDDSTGTPDTRYANPNDEVFVSIPDGQGGWYIGGDFTMVGDSVRNRLAQIDSAGEVTAWNPDVNGVVRTMVLSAGHLFFGGNFTKVGGLTRNRLACVSTLDGTPTSWQPQANFIVFSMVLQDSILYVGGGFTSLANANINYPRSRLGAIDANSGAILNFNVSVQNTVRAIEVSGHQLFIGGDFLSCSGVARGRGASVNRFSGALSNWNPSANNPIHCLLAHDSVIFIGGAFSEVQGQPINRLACLDTIFGNLDSWNPNVSQNVLSMTKANGVLYVAGDFLKSQVFSLIELPPSTCIIRAS